jgi:hypothetical protein
MALTPVIEFDRYYFMHYAGKTFKEIYEEMEDLRKKVKNSIDYFWDNSHFRICNIYGKPILKVGFYKNDISFWNFVTSDALGTFRGKDGKLTQSEVDEIRVMIDYVTKGKRKCLECGQWVNSGETYSFAGFVCSECYDPEIHLPPDPS